MSIEKVLNSVKDLICDLQLCHLVYQRCITDSIERFGKIQSEHIHGLRSVGEQGDMSPYFLKWMGRSVFCPPTFSGVDIFVLMHTVFIG